MKTLSIIVPVFMEAENIRGAIKNVIWAAEEAELSDYEVIIIDCKKKNGEDDGTPLIAEELSKSNSKIRAIHNPYMSLAKKYWQGVGLAKFEYVTWVPGDDVVFPESLREIFETTGKADLICCYISNPEVRPMKRRIVSKAFNIFMNIIFGMHLRYFNSISVIRTDLLKSLPQSTKDNEGLSFVAEILIRLIKSGHSYIEMPHRIKPDPKKAKASGIIDFLLRYDPKNTLKAIAKLFWDVQIKKNSLKI